VFADILSYLSYHPNFLRQVAPVWWAVFAGVCVWQAAISWSVHRQTGMHSYVAATVGNLLMMVGGILAPVAQNALQVVLFPAPLLLGGFMVLSLSDARSWFSPEAHDKYYLVRHGGLRLRLFGLVPAGFQHQESVAASWLQGVLIGCVTLAFLGFVYCTVWQVYEREVMDSSSFGWITLASGLIVFHCLALIICALLFGSPLKKRRTDEQRS
jgi:hypothetical protein